MEKTQLVEGIYSLTSITMVSKLVDAYLLDGAADINLKFQSSNLLLLEFIFVDMQIMLPINELF